MPEQELNSTAAAAPAPAAEAAVQPARGHRKERMGQVISNKMQKTIVVRVQRRIPHPRFKKVITRFSKLYAHDEEQQAQIGDRVRLQECRPLSRTKRWRLVEVVMRNTRSKTDAAEPAPGQA